MKKKSKSKVKECPCACVPPPRKRRPTPAYAPRPPPQFYSPLPMPQSQFTADTVKRIVQDEFKRYHSTRPRVIRGEMATQTETADGDFPDDVSERTFGMTSAIEEMQTVGGDPEVQKEENKSFRERARRELDLRYGAGFDLEAAREAAREQFRRANEMEAARAAFKPTPLMEQPEDEPRMIRGRYGLGDVRREEMREFLISGVEERNPSME
jgi:hypothetical protein